MTLGGPAPGFAIRLAGAADAGTVRRINVDAYISAYLPVIGAVPKPAKEDQRLRIERGQVWLLDAPAPVGVLILEPAEGALLVYSLAVAPEAQGRGHAGRLLRFADIRAEALGLPELRLFTNARMADNIALYEAHGFRETGRRPHPSRMGEILVDMTKAISTPARPPSRAS